MPRKKHTPEHVINTLREAEVVLAQGRTVAEEVARSESRSRHSTVGVTSTGA